MSKSIVTLEPAKGVYQAAAKPYQRWTERAEMSRDMRVHEEIYRIVVIIARWKSVHPRKMMVCDPNGAIVKDENLTRHCFRNIQYLARFRIYENALNKDATQGNAAQHEPLIEAFKKIHISLKPVLTDREKEHFHLHAQYLEEIYRLSKEIQEIALQIQAMEKRLQEHVQVIEEHHMDSIIQLFHTFKNKKSKLEAWFLEDQESRRVIQNVLQKSEKRHKVPAVLQPKIKGVLSETYNAMSIEPRMLRGIQEESGYEKIEECIHFLRHEVQEETFIQKGVQQNMQYNWVLSEECAWP